MDRDALFSYRLSWTVYMRDRTGQTCGARGFMAKQEGEVREKVAFPTIFISYTTWKGGAWSTWQDTVSALVHESWSQVKFNETTVGLKGNLVRFEFLIKFA